MLVFVGNAVLLRVRQIIKCDDKTVRISVGIKKRALVQKAS